MTDDELLLKMAEAISLCADSEVAARVALKIAKKELLERAALAKEAADELEKALAESDAARALADKLAEALRPFADISAQFDDTWANGAIGWVDVVEHPVPSIADLRSAAAALAEYDAARDKR